MIRRTTHHAVKRSDRYIVVCPRLSSRHTIASSSHIVMYHQRMITSYHYNYRHHGASYCKFDSCPYNRMSMIWPTFRLFSTVPENDPNHNKSSGENLSSNQSSSGDELEDDFSHLVDRTCDVTVVPSNEAVLDLATVVGNSSPSSAISSWEPCYSHPADLVIESLRWIHDATGLEYAWCIVSFVGLVRLGLFPMLVVAGRNNSRIEYVGLLRQKMMTTLNMEDLEHRAKLSRETKSLLDQHGVKGIYSVLPHITVAPFAIAFVMGFYKMSKVFHDDLATGGILWFPDLTVPDPMYMLPLVNAFTYLVVSEWVKSQSYDPFAPSNSRKNFSRGVALLFIPLGAGLPAGLVLSWQTFYLISFGNSLLFRNRLVANFFGIWDTKSLQQQIGVGISNDTALSKERRPIRRGGRKR